MFFNMRTGRELWAGVNHLYDKKEWLDDNRLEVEEIKDDSDMKKFNRGEKGQKMERKTENRSMKKLMKTRSEGFKKKVEREMKRYMEQE